MLTVGIGIGGCTVVFAIVDVLWIRGLPYDGADRISWIYTAYDTNRFPFSVADYQTFTEGQTTFESVGAIRRMSGTVLAGDEPRRVTYDALTPGVVGMLGLSVIGRESTPADAEQDAEPTVVVTAGYASRELDASDPADALGRTVRIDDVAHTVIGVLGAEPGPLLHPSGFYPTLRLAPPSRRGPFFLRVYGKRRSDVAPEAARADLRALDRRQLELWYDSYSEDNATWDAANVGAVLRGGSEGLVLLLGAAVGLLMIIGTANATNLLLTRVAARRGELSLRAALGATRSQITGHLLLESALLAGAGVLVGLALARLGLGVAPEVAGAYLPRLGEAGLNARVVAFAGALTAVTLLIFALVPAAIGRRGRELSADLGAGGRGAGAGRAELRAQRALVTAQLTVAVPLLAGAGLLLATLRARESQDPGFDPGRTYSVRVSVPRGVSAEPGERALLWRRLVEAVQTLPGIERAGVATGRPPATSGGNLNNFDLEDRPTPPGTNQPVANWMIADAGYFAALGLPLVEGRMLTDEDQDTGTPVVLVDEAWARRYFPGETVLGRRLHEGGSPEWTTVVGVVGTAPYSGLGEDTGGTVYAPWTSILGDAYLTVRARADAVPLAPAVRAELRRVGPDLALSEEASGEALLRDSLAQPRHLGLLSSVFAFVALLLAVVGLYGVTAAGVQRRRSDIAVRLALGGSRATVVGQVVRQGMTLAGVGLVAGIAAALGGGRVFAAFVFGVSPRDAGLLAAVSLAMLAVSLTACLVPALRAARLDPGTALRGE